ncbi:hypothetical protein ARAM_007212 [Aspergillus rambellii]|uniref:UspA domain-containing protein n=1 Tax=Aspergillus rambellii TaxID=308745 RepID=A0A0F8U4G2_9EURO|nr:hypothetical protein ARAM_007212 [Aspergillus rambellii]
MPSSGRRPGGLAAALEEERIELASSSIPSSQRSRSWQHALPRRSILDTALTPTPDFIAPRHGSIAGIGVGVTPPAGRISYHDSAMPSTPQADASPAPSSSMATPSTTPKITYTNLKTAPPPAPKPLEPSTLQVSNNPPEARRPSIRWDSRLDMPPSANGLRRSSQPNAQEKEKEKAPKALLGKNAMAAVMSGLDLKVGLPSFSRGRDSNGTSSTRGNSLDSRLPASARPRSSSPRRRWLNSNLRISRPDSPKPTLDNAKVNKAEPMDEKSLDSRASRRGPLETNARTSASGDDHLEKDLYDNNENKPIESSEEEEEEEENSSSSDEDLSPNNSSEDVKRGRRTDRDIPRGSGMPNTKGSPEEAAIEHNKSEGSQMIHSSKQGPVPRNPDIHSQMGFDSPSAANTPFGSEDEAELSDIKRAQKLSIQMSTIDNSVPNRSIRTIIRGDYSSMQGDAEGGRRRQRKYLVTTDLSEESVYALEWTIGTILRDGDTMFAVFAVHEETGTQIGEGANAAQDVAAVVGSQTVETVKNSQNESSGTNISRAILGRLGTGTDSKPGSVDARAMSKAEAERAHAVQVISQTCVRLLRKTLLQVRIAIEVIHCKSPKHMITEAIDGLEPTLVIVGARSRSALKGVLLGSFSNYLITHSSVPVMVARKKLKKQTKTKKTNVRLSNNLTTPKKLVLAKVD